MQWPLLGGARTWQANPVVGGIPVNVMQWPLLGGVRTWYAIPGTIPPAPTTTYVMPWASINGYRISFVTPSSIIPPTPIVIRRGGGKVDVYGRDMRDLMDLESMAVLSGIFWG
jgi:hypothetical protein